MPGRSAPLPQQSLTHTIWVAFLSGRSCTNRATEHRVNIHPLPFQALNHLVHKPDLSRLAIFTHSFKNSVMVSEVARLSFVLFYFIYLFF